MSKICTFIAAIALGAISAYAVPAMPGLRTITQPDGTTVQAELRGDEFCSFYVGADGLPMKFDADGYLRYVVATTDDSFVLSANAADAANTDATYSLLARIGAAERVRMNAPTMAEASAAVARNIARAEGQDVDPLPQKGMGLMARQNFPTQGEIKSVVILVSYKDVDFTVSDPHDYYTRHLNQEGFSDYNAVGSCRDFFIENSHSQFIPQFDLYGPVKLSKNRSYYGGDNGQRHDPYAYQMVIEACAALDSSVDFSQYDLDGDGVIDNIYVIYAGQGQASYGSADTVWPHSSTITNGPVHDGVRVGRYATSNEWEYQRPDGIGTFVHEFSHVMGLPDLYETSYSTGARTPGAWSTMDQGPYNGDGCCPPYYSGYERNALGWIDLDLINGPLTADLKHVGESNQAYIIQTINEKEFYVLENRQKTGWDSYIPGHGLLVWHVDFEPTVFNSNIVNNNPNHQYVDIVECGGSTQPAGYTFPGTGFVKQREISPNKNTLIPWVGPDVPYYITDIYERPKSGEPNHITFNVDGGLADLAAPVALAETNASAAGFTANWEAVEDAAKYALTVYADHAANQENTTLAFGESTDRAVILPEGWVFTGLSNDYFTTASFAGQSIPSLRFNSNGVSLTSPLFEAEITDISFFLRGGATNATSVFLIEGRNDESEAWRTIESVIDLTYLNSKGQVLEADISAAHVRQLKFTFYSSAGRVGFDDLALTFGDSYRAIFCTKTVDTTSADIEVTENDPLKYSYTVKALNASGLPGAVSNEVTVDLSPYSGIANVTVDTPWNVAVDGNSVVYTGSAGVAVTAVNAAGAVVANTVADANGIATLSLPSSGFYIIATPQGSVKVIL